MGRPKTSKSSSQYFGVHRFRQKNPQTKWNHYNDRWVANLKRCNGFINSYHKTEREAAIAIDKFLIENGEEPKNILKRKL